MIHWDWVLTGCVTAVASAVAITLGYEALVWLDRMWWRFKDWRVNRNRKVGGYTDSGRPWYIYK